MLAGRPTADAYFNPAQTRNARGFFGPIHGVVPYKSNAPAEFESRTHTEFFGAVESIEDGRSFRASRHARGDHNDKVETEMREFRKCANAVEAEKWIAQKTGAARVS